jgi:hypothetical protein
MNIITTLLSILEIAMQEYMQEQDFEEKFLIPLYSGFEGDIDIAALKLKPCYEQFTKKKFSDAQLDRLVKGMIDQAEIRADNQKITIEADDLLIALNLYRQAAIMSCVLQAETDTKKLQVRNPQSLATCLERIKVIKAGFAKEENEVGFKIVYASTMLNNHYGFSHSEIPEILDQDPLEFLKLLSRDYLLPIDQRFLFVEILLLRHKYLLKQTTDQESIDLLGHYWMDQANLFLLNNRRKMIWAYQQVSPRSKYYMEACREITISQFRIHHDKHGAIGLRLGAEQARFYLQGIKTTADNEISEITMMQGELHKESIHTRLYLSLKIFPCAVQQALTSWQEEKKFLKKTSIVGFFEETFLKDTMNSAQHLTVDIELKMTNGKSHEIGIDLRAAEDFFKQLQAFRKKYFPTDGAEITRSLDLLERNLSEIVDILRQKSSLDKSSVSSTMPSNR